MITNPTSALLTIVNALIASDAPWDTLTWRLYVNPANITPATQVSDLTEATFTGYAPVVGSSWGTPYADPSGNAIVYGGNAVFISTSVDTDVTIYGWYATSGATDAEALVFVESIPGGIPLSGASVGITVQQLAGLVGPVSGNATAA